MARNEVCELTCMVMVYDHDGNVLVQDKIGKRWHGVTFPGGHVEQAESFVDCAIREVKEETGLTVWDLKLCGVKQFQTQKDNVRYIVFYFKTDQYSGNIKSSEEGEVFWVKRDKLFAYDTVEDFDKMTEVFESDSLNENIYAEDEDGTWKLFCK